MIAIKPGFLSLRVLDQCKAYSPGHVVTANDVRAMAGADHLRDQIDALRREFEEKWDRAEDKLLP